MNRVLSVNKGSIGEELGIEPGDILVSINGQAVKDIVEYKFLISEENIEIVVKKENGEEWEYEIEKEYDEDLGIVFEKPILDNARRCANKCIFCFIDQLPPGMRSTLYFKDDDSRLSFLHGNFITLTNMSDRDMDRIIKYRISPLNISVHTTDPELRIKMLGNKRAGNILDIIKKLSDNGIDINCQIVLCREINDGSELEKTINDLYKFFPRVRNVAIVPVGITRYRENLYPMIPFDKESSSAVIDLVEGIQNKIHNETGEYFVRLADEFYIMAHRPIPDYEHYGEFEQLEDGIGMIANFMHNVIGSLENLSIKRLDRALSIATGELAYEYLTEVCDAIQQRVHGLQIKVYKIINNFFGGKITVAGLLTGKDINEQLKGKDLGEFLLLPSNLLKADTQILLDDVSINDLKDLLNVNIRICRFDGMDFIDNVCG